MLEHLKFFSQSAETATSAYIRLRDAIEGIIRSGQISSGARLPSVRDIADTCGVGVTTVTRAMDLLRRDGLVVARRGSGVFIAAEAQARDAVVVYLCVHPGYLRGSCELAFRKMQGMFHASRHIHFHPITSPEEFDRSAGGRLGVIFFDDNYMVDGFGEVVEHVQDQGIPHCVGSAYEGPLPCVQPYHQQALELATDYLLRLGHRRIGLFNALDNSPNPQASLLYRHNRDGYLSAFRKRRVPHPPTLYVEAPGDDCPSFAVETEKVLDTLLARSAQITAIVCNNDTRAMLVMELLVARGIRVPEDVSVIGMDNLNASERTSPPLTTVDNLISQTGEAVVDYVLRRIQGDDPPLPRAHTKLVVRASTRPSAGSGGDVPERKKRKGRERVL